MHYLDTIGSERRFQLLVDAVRDYAIYLLDENGFVRSWNAGAERFKGYTAGEIIGQHFSKFYTEEDRASELPKRALETAAREGKFEAEGWRVRKDGTRFWTSVLIDAIRDEAGTLIGFAKVTRDITERKRAQEEIDKTKEALSQAQKMEAIGRLTGGVAHDFNNLLTVILGSAEVLRNPHLSEEARTRYVEAIADTAERAALLTGQLLAFARRQPLRPERFDAAMRVKGMQQIVSTTVGSPVRVEVDLAEAGEAVEADPNQFETAILNMVINAKDAMPSGGTLKLKVGSASGVPAVRGHAAAVGDFVAVSVEDTGTGIEPVILSRIFEPFYTTKAVNKGTGLGLSQVYGFAKQSGGEIAVVSTVGKGSTFTLYLPRSTAPVSEARNEATAGPVPKLAPQAILLVEDNDTVGEFAVGLLTEMGQSVTWATHAEAALSVLHERHGEFDLVFSDVVMPGPSGIDLAREIRRLWPELPIVLTSGYSHVLAEEGSHGFKLIQKPYSVKDLVGLLGNSDDPGPANRAA